MFYIRFFTLSIVILSSLSVIGIRESAQAQSRTVQATGSNKSASFTLQPGTDLSSPIYFYYVSRGNLSRIVEFTLEGPAGISATVEAAPFTGSAQQTASTMRGSYAVPLSNPLRIAANASAQSYRTFNVPNGCTQELYDLYLLLIEFTPELAGITPEQFCANANGGGTDPGEGGPPTGQIGNRDLELGLVRKNACGRANARTVVRMRVNLSGINPAEIQSAVTIKGSFKERRYNGSMAASIKPRSDGMFAPAPLLLMSSINGGSEVITQTKWRRGAGGIASSTPVRIENYVYYRNLVLTRSVITNLLTGRGKATFDINDGQRAYSVCFRLQRVRQNRNGYPNGDGDG